MFGKLFMGVRAVFCMAGRAKGTVAKEGILQYCVLAVLRHRDAYVFSQKGKRIIPLERRVLEGESDSEALSRMVLEESGLRLFQYERLDEFMRRDSLCKRKQHRVRVYGCVAAGEFSGQGWVWRFTEGELAGLPLDEKIRAYLAHVPIIGQAR